MSQQLDLLGGDVDPNTVAVRADAIERALALLADHGYLVLPRFEPKAVYRADDGRALKVGVVLDTEGTGRDAATAGLLELGMVRFSYDPATGHVYRVLGVFDELHDPGIPVEEEASKVNGITDAMVAGKAIDAAAVAAFLADVDGPIIAHNAAYDRPLCERYFPVFAEKSWGCSFTQIDWQTESLGSAKLEWIALKRGFHYAAHRAEIDCRVLLHILSLPMNHTGEPALKMLLDRHCEATYHLWAVSAPFEIKDVLKMRDYRWSGEKDARNEKAWHRDFSEAELISELDWLKKHAFNGQGARPMIVDVVDASSRFSHRRVGTVTMKLDHFVGREPQPLAAAPASVEEGPDEREPAPAMG